MKNINLGIKKMNNFMLISNLLTAYCNKTFRRHPDQIVQESSVRGGENISPVRPGFVHPQIPSFSLVPDYSGDFLCEEKKERAQRGIEPTVLTSIYKGIIIACSTCGLIAIVRNFSYGSHLYLDMHGTI